MVSKSLLIISKNTTLNSNYMIIKNIEAGLIIHGWEVKSIKKYKVDINKTYIYYIKNEIYIYNLYIKKYLKKTNLTTSSKRIIKLLLHNKEIKLLINLIKKKQHLLIPIYMYINEKKLLKIMIGIFNKK